MSTIQDNLGHLPSTFEALSLSVGPRPVFFLFVDLSLNQCHVNENEIMSQISK